MKQRARRLDRLVSREREDLIREHKKDFIPFLCSTSLPEQNTNQDRETLAEEDAVPSDRLS